MPSRAHPGPNGSVPAAGSLHAWLVPHVVLPAYERLTGRRLWTEVRRLRGRQWQSPAEVEARAIGRLRPLLAHAGAHVAFYRELFDDAGVDPRTIRSTEDLARLPIVDKSALRRRPPDDVTASNLRARRRWKSVTSGSTGFPFEFYADPAAADETLASYLFFLEWAGAALWQTRLDLGVRQGRSWATAPWLASRASRLGRRLLLGGDTCSLLALDLAPEELCAVVARIHRRDGYFIRTYPAYAGRLAAALVDRGIELPRPPAVVISCSETLTGARAAVIRRAFRAPVVSHYSCWEVLHLAQTCPDNPEALHVNPDRAIVWVARADGTPAAPKEHGRLILTALSNYVQPFINYDIGDWAATAGPCPCGRGWPTLTALEGRTAEVVRTPSGRLISPILLNQLPALGARAVPSIWEYQLQQTAADRVVFRVVPAARFTAAVAEELERDLRACLGPEMGLQLDVVEGIPPEPSGKRPIIVPFTESSGDV